MQYLVKNQKDEFRFSLTGFGARDG